MPRQQYRDNQLELMAPVAAGVARLGSDISTGIANTEQAFKQQGVDRQNEAANQRAFAEVKGFFGNVNGVRLTGLEPKKNELNTDYVARLKTAAPALVQQLKDSGVDPEELKSAIAIPGFALDDVKKLIYQRTGSQLEKQLLRQPAAADTIADVRAGVLSVDEINKKHGTNITGDEYNQIAGIAAPTTQIVKPAPTGGTIAQYSGNTPPAAASAQYMGNVQKAAAADQPITTEQAMKTAGVNQPLSYANARSMVQTADLPPEEKARFEPILTTVVNREASHIAKVPHQTQTGFFSETMKQGLPLTKEQEELAKGLRSDQDAANKARYNAMRQKEQDNSLLRILVQDAHFNATMEHTYGKDVAAAVTQLNKKLLEYQDLQNQLNIAMGTTDAVSEKEVQDPAVIMDKQRILNNEIDQLRGKIPDIDRKLEDFKYRAATIRMPVLDQPPVTYPQPPAPKEKPSLASERYKKK